jgi:hypothetical protein
VLPFHATDIPLRDIMVDAGLRGCVIEGTKTSFEDVALKSDTILSDSALDNDFGN